ncbi:MAG TPA: hypothetical protein DDZ82_07590 [Rhodobacteraceae bacterium]|nr:hypothetical protein [Paracoccaceae bacterium]
MFKFLAEIKKICGFFEYSLVSNLTVRLNMQTENGNVWFPSYHSPHRFWQLSLIENQRCITLRMNEGWKATYEII